MSSSSKLTEIITYWQPGNCIPDAYVAALEISQLDYGNGVSVLYGCRLISALLCYRLSIRLSVCLSVTRVDQSKWLSYDYAIFTEQ